MHSSNFHEDVETKCVIHVTLGEYSAKENKDLICTEQKTEHVYTFPDHVIIEALNLKE